MSKYVLTLEAMSSIDAIRELRWSLKYLLRARGFRCTDIREEREEITAPSSGEVLRTVKVSITEPDN
jgi:hypothetical protein